MSLSEAELRAKRGSIKGRLTTFKNYLEMFKQMKDVSKCNFNELKIRLGKIDLLFEEYDQIQTKIEMAANLKLKEEEWDFKDREETEKVFYYVISLAQELLSVNESHSFDDALEGAAHASSAGSAGAGARLPTIKLPTFNGNPNKWLEFRDTYLSIVHNNESLTDICKYQYLKASLLDSAASVIESLEISSANYAVAWKLVSDRFDNKRQLVHTHLKSLFNVSFSGRECAISLRFLIDHISKHLRALNSLGEQTNNWDTLIIFLFASKLDSVTVTKWEEHRNTLTDSPTLECFYNFLRHRADVLEMVSASTGDKADKQPYKRIDKFQKAFVATTASDAIPTSSTASIAKMCRICNGDHALYNCVQLGKMSVDERNDCIKKLRVCINCFRGGHFSHQCKASPCAICRRKHNTLLHKTFSSANQGQGRVEASKESVSTPISLSACVENQVLLSTAIIMVKNNVTNEYFEARCLLDCGSQSSFITEALMKKLGLQGELIDTVRVTGINNIAFHALRRCTVSFQPRSNSKQHSCKKVNAYVIPQITNALPTEEVDVSEFVIPKNIILADPNYYKPAQIDLLLGADVFWQIIQNEKLLMGKGRPILQNSLFGWLMVGPVMVSNTPQLKNIHCGFSREIREQLSKFWELEEVPTTPVLSPEEEACEEHFKQNTRRLADGRFCVTLPLNSNAEYLGDSYKLARKRFDSLEKRFKRQPDVKSQYVDFIKEYAELGHLSESVKPTNAFFLPHHPVLKEQSESTKCRVVFDGSAKSESGYSLNDVLMVGPTVQDDIFSILIRFRQHTFIFTGDIEKMYRQIAVEPTQRHLQMILWRGDESERMKYFQLNTVTYGTSCAPFLSTRCLVQLGQECSDHLVGEVIMHDFYIDDLNTGLDDENELISLYQKITDILDTAHFNLRKIKSNSKEFLKCVAQSDNSPQDNLKLSKHNNTLGVEWDPNTDNILMTCSKLQSIGNHVKYTKRTVLSLAASIFDPLGLLSVCVILCKIFLQSLWIQKLDWDEDILQAPNCIWARFVNTMHHLVNVSVPRHAICNNAVTTEIHAFSDASLKAYAGCIYLHSVDALGNSTVRLLTAKAKVSPLKTLTVARLELCGSLLVSRLCKKVLQALRCKIAKCWFWTDSKIVLGWLSLPSYRLCTFVSHRVAEVNDICNNAKWMYVPSAHNPADLASRGVYPDELASLSLWWEGPSFLKDKEQWPEQAVAIQTDLPEIRALTITVDKPDTKTKLIEMSNFSSFLRLRRIFAYVCRFVNAYKNKQCDPITGSLTVNELEQAELKLAYISQQESFSEFYNDKNKAIPGLSKLNPYVDHSELIRVGGRLDNSEFNFDKKHPIVLSIKHHFTILLFRHYHLKLMHAPPQLLLSVVREQYWPLNGRALARKTFRSCTRCKRMKGEVAQQIMGNLPSQRIVPGFPFEVVGTDYAGPFLFSDKKGRGAKLNKCYLCIFVDFKVKAVHLELVSSLCTEGFILALRRFISRRGKPREIFSDNGGNFVGTNREFTEFLNAHSNSVSEAFIDDGIKFNFSPVRAPNFGGLFESGIKTAKYHLKRVLGNTHLTFEELTTLLTQIEAIMNSRPLHPMSSSPHDLSPLTPGHFLIGRPLTSLPAPDLQQVNPSRLHRYARIEQARQHFWARWSQEYICELQQRNRWQQRHPNIEPGQLVLIKDEKTSPLQWPMGRIQAVFPGSDGACRVADIFTSKGTIRRAINRICPFLNKDEDENDST